MVETLQASGSKQLIPLDDISENLKFRIEFHKNCEQREEARQAALALFHKDLISFFALCLFTYDPRQRAYSGSADRPFLPWDYQIDYILKINSHVAEGIDILTEKSRDMGATWMVLGVFLYRWLILNENFLLGSRKEELVDTMGDMDTLFERLRYMIKHIPAWLLDYCGYNERNSGYMKIYKENGASLVGESMNENFSRQGRYNCLLGDTQVLTSLGWMSIADAMREEIEYFIGQDGKLRKVKRYVKNLPQEEIVNVKTKYGFSLTMTSNHRVITPNGKRCAKELNVGDEIKCNLVEYFPTAELCTETEAEVLGFLVSEGAVSGRSYIGFVQKEEEVLARYISSFETAFGISPFQREVTRKHINGTSTTWMVAERSMIKVREKLLSYGLARVKADKKTVPYVIFQSNRKIQKAFLCALFEGDGSVSYSEKTNQLRISYATKSFELARGIQLLLFNFGLLAGLKHDTRHGKDLYYVQLDCLRAKKFCEEIGFISKRKNDVQLRYHPKSKYLNHPCNPNIKQQKLKIVTINRLKPDVTYDVEIDGDHIFIANGLLSHNSILLDEFAFVPIKDEAIWMACGDSAPCKVVLSTPHGNRNKFARLRNSGKIEVATLHWRLHPRKDLKWYAEQKAKRTDTEIAQEVDINYNISAGKPFYVGFSRAYHLQKLTVLRDKELILGWDFGYIHPCCVVSQLDTVGRWLLQDCIFGENEEAENFGNRVKEILAMDYSNIPARSFGDPAGEQRSDKRKESTVEILQKIGFNIYSTASNSPDTNYDARKRIIEGKLKLLISGAPALLVNDIPRNQIIVEGFEGGYRYPDSNKYGHIHEGPVHDSYYSHVFNAIEYIAVNLFRAVQASTPASQYRKSARYHEIVDNSNAGFSFKR